MVFKQDYAFWSLVHHIVTKEHFRILKISESQNEVWLESLENKHAQLIRLLRYDLDWSNWMHRDMEATLHNVEKVRRKFNKKNVRALNIYVSTYPPVDEWSFRLEKPLAFGKQKQSSLQTYLIHTNDFQTGVKDLSTFFGTSIQIENENFVYDTNIIKELKHEVLTVAKNRAKSEQKLFYQGKPLFTYLFIATQVIMFLVLEMNGGSTNPLTLLKYGAKESQLIIEGQWWRFLTPIVLHIGFFHLFMNTLALYYLGTAVERIYGNVRFFLIYLLSGFTGSVASFAFSPSISAGASGAIFGCFGALLYFGVVYPRLFFRTMGMNIIVVLAINLLLGLLIPIVDNAGHIGGLIGGFLAAGVLHLPKHRQLFRQIVLLIIMTVITLGLLYYGYNF